MTKQIKAIMLGASGVGKTSIINAFLKVNKENVESTLRYDLYYFRGSIDGVDFSINLWDVPGQTQYAPMTQTFLRNTDIALIVYDITSEDSFDRVDSDYKLLMEETLNANVLIIGNKCDLESERKILQTVGENYADQISAQFFEASAKYQTNTAEIFEALQLIASKVEKPVVDNLDITKSKEEKKGCC